MKSKKKKKEELPDRNNPFNIGFYESYDSNPTEEREKERTRDFFESEYTT